MNYYFPFFSSSLLKEHCWLVMLQSWFCKEYDKTETPLQWHGETTRTLYVSHLAKWARERTRLHMPGRKESRPCWISPRTQRRTVFYPALCCKSDFFKIYHLGLLALCKVTGGQKQKEVKMCISPFSLPATPCLHASLIKMLLIANLSPMVTICLEELPGFPVSCQA